MRAPGCPGPGGLSSRRPGPGLALVTGASSGIGLSIATLLGEAGWAVHGLSRRSGAGPFTPHRCDVTDTAQVAATVAQIAGRAEIDAVVLAAGTNLRQRHLDRLQPDGWEEVLHTNLSGAFNVFQAVLPHLRDSQGSAIFIASVSALWPDRSGPAYQASKAGVLALARAAALEEHRHGVRVSCLLPGVVDTPLLEKRPEPPDRDLIRAALRPEDVARVCLFLLQLPKHAYIPELTLLPTALQAPGAT